VSTVLFFHAHPDDEAIATGGTMAAMAEQGHRVLLVTATRGELGEEPDDLERTGQSLAERRTDELATANRILGVHRHWFLDYRDSGMAGDERNLDHGCFAQAPVEEAAERLVGLLADETVDILVTYDEHGGYGHPDHIQVHRVGMRAAALAGVPAVYLSTMDRDFMRDVMAQAADLLGDEVDAAELAEDRADEVEELGEPAERITTEVDVRPWLERKRAAMRAHASQIGETSFFLAMPDEAFERVWGQEWFIRISPEPGQQSGRDDRLRTVGD
jgi:LmbE family N-acetylglucosaminyl deacetylase